jgi:malonyl-CoA/methylmalonyl-CoA synthetase
MDADGAGTLATGAEARAPLAEVAERGPDDIAAILYTSGTTGRSKGAMLSNDNLGSNIAALIAAWGFTDRDVLIHALPLFHTHGLFVALNMALASGRRCISCRSSTPTRCWASCRTRPC